MRGSSQVLPSLVLVHSREMMPQSVADDFHEESAGVAGCTALGTLRGRVHEQRAGFTPRHQAGVRGFLMEHSESRRARQVFRDHVPKARFRRNTRPLGFWFLDPRRGILLVPWGCQSRLMRGPLGCQIIRIDAVPIEGHNEPGSVAISRSPVVDRLEPAMMDEL